MCPSKPPQAPLNLSLQTDWRRAPPAGPTVALQAFPLPPGFMKNLHPSVHQSTLLSRSEGAEEHKENQPEHGKLSKTLRKPRSTETPGSGSFLAIALHQKVATLHGGGGVAELLHGGGAAGGDSPIPLGGRQESSTRSIRKGVSLTGASLSRVLSTSPPGRGSPATGVLEEEQEERPGSPGGSIVQT